MDEHHQSDSDALASALGAIGAGHNDNDETTHHFHHQLQAPDFSLHKQEQSLDVTHDLTGDHHVDLGQLDAHGLDIPVEGEEEMEVGVQSGEDLDLGLTGMDNGDLDDAPHRPNSYGRPPSIRKACDLCHAAKQKCSGDRPSCTRCAAGGWACVYAPRQRRRTVPKEIKLAMSAEQSRSPPLSAVTNQPPPAQSSKKRKIGPRDSLGGGFGSGEMDMKLAMGMAVDLGLTGEDEGDELMTMTDDQMLESIAIDGYLADLPLATFVHNLPYNAPPPTNDNFGDEYASAADNAFPSADMDQHTTSALRDAIFSLNESSGAVSGHHETGDGGHGDATGEGPDGIDPHLALLDLSHAMPGEGEEGESDNEEEIDINYGHSSGCSHSQLVPHILSLLTSHTLEPKPGSNTPLTLGVFSPLARSLRLFHALVSCPVCSSSPSQTLPQLALLSRTTTILTFPFPPISTSSVGSNAQITLHGARLTGTGLSEAIEQHIVGVVWDSWRAAIREIFANLERKAQEVITQSSMAISAANAENAAAGGNQAGQNGSSGGAHGNNNGQSITGPETQRAGLMFQAMSRLVTAMDEVEDN